MDGKNEFPVIDKSSTWAKDKSEVRIIHECK